MTDAYKSKEQLIAELEELRRRLADVQAAGARAAWARAEGSLRDPDALGTSPPWETAAPPEPRTAAIVDLAPVGIARIDARGRFIDANPALLELTGYTQRELEGRRFTDFIPREEAAIVLTDFKALVEGARVRCRTDARCRRKDGRLVWVDITVSLAYHPDGQPAFFLAVIQDESVRQQTEDVLRQENQRLAAWVADLEQRTREVSLLSESGDLLQACRTGEEAYTVIGRMAGRLFPGDSGYVCVSGATPNLVEAMAVWGTPPGDRLFSLDDCWGLRRGRVHVVHDPDADPICKHVRAGAGHPYLCVPMMAHGEAVGLLHLSTADQGRMSESKQRLATTVAEHIALALANLKLRETLRRQSIRDPLTGLFNRRYMEESLEREMRRAHRGRHPVGIIMLDLDHFKEFNDRFGHEAGDTLLREVGAVLQRSIRAEDIACRYGGEEFTLILPEASLLDAAQRAEQIREAIRTVSVIHRRQALGQITVSLGVAIFPDHGPTGDAVLRAADAALYQAKAEGRDRVSINPGGADSVDRMVDLPGR